jgi:hypothetical protein
VVRRKEPSMSLLIHHREKTEINYPQKKITLNLPLLLQAVAICKGKRLSLIKRRIKLRRSSLMGQTQIKMFQSQRQTRGGDLMMCREAQQTP